MAAKKVGALIKEARTNAGLTQEELAKKVTGLTASDISKAERGEKEITKEQLKSIAKITGVTQKSLLDAAGENYGKNASASSTSKTSGKTSSGKTSSGKTSSASSSEYKLTAAEKKVIDLYRAADKDAKTAAILALGGNPAIISSSSGSSSDVGSMLSGLLGGAMNNKGVQSLITQALKDSMGK